MATEAKVFDDYYEVCQDLYRKGYRIVYEKPLEPKLERSKRDGEV